jgi:TolB-like protein
LSAPPNRPSGIIDELRRRKVFRAAAVYAAVGFILVQVANNFFPALHLPPWTTTLVAALVILGLPVALVLAWALELTPDGLRRTTSAEVDAADAPAQLPAPGGPSEPRLVAPRIAAVAGALVLAAAGGAFLLTNGGTSSAATERELERSIAVLPFANLSADAENEHLSDGITEDLRGRLSRMGELRVISRTSAMGYKGTVLPAREIGRELGVAHLLEGTVQRSRDRLRVAAQLVDARTDEMLWSESYDRDVTDIFEIQSEIAGRIAEALRLRLNAGDRARLGRAQTTNLAAYEVYLRADQLMRRWGSSTAERRASVLTAAALARQAIELDPDYAAPYALLSWIYEEHPDLSVRERRDSTRAFAARVIRMAPELSDGYAELGWYHMSLGDLGGAGQQFRLALDRDPNSEVALAGMRDYERASGRPSRSLPYARAAIEVAPTDPASYAELARIYATLGDFDEAEAWFRKAWFEVADRAAWGYCELADLARHRRDPAAVRRYLDALLALDSPGEFALHCAAYMELALGNPAAARAIAARGISSPLNPDGVPRLLLAALALEAGETARAHVLLAEAEAMFREIWELCEGRCYNHNLAQIRALQGRTDEAIDYVRRAVETGWTGWYPSTPHPILASIEDDPRYQTILAEFRARMDRERERARDASERRAGGSGGG